MKVIMAFAIPLVISNLFQQFYNMADSIIVGNFAGVEALAAVGASAPFAMLFVMMGNGLSRGCSVVVAQFFGARNYQKMKTCVYTGLFSFLCVGLLFAAVGVMLTKPALRLLDTPSSIMPAATKYLNIYICGMPLLFLYNAANAIFNALGDSKKPLYFLIFSSVLNVGLDVLFVGKFQLGVAGAAWATLIAQGVACALSLTTLLRKVRSMKAEENELVPLFHSGMLWNIYRIGLPAMLQSCSVSIGALFVQSLVNGYGPDVIAGYAAATKINTLVSVVILSLGFALSTFTAQNVGAHNFERPRQGVRAVLLVEITYCILACGLVLFFGDQLIRMFAGATASEEMLGAGRKFFSIVVPSYVLFSLMNACKAVSQGAGYMLGYLISTLLDILVRIGVSFAMISVIGYYAICVAYPAGWLVGAIVAAAFYFSNGWKKGVMTKGSDIAEQEAASGNS